MDLSKQLSLLRARKVFRQTKVLYPTNGAAPFSVGNPWDFEGLEQRLGVVVKKIPYRELSAEMERLLGDPAEGQQAKQDAAELLRKADRSFLEEHFVTRSMVFDRCLRNLMARHGCNAFTIDCFEFCPSLLPQKWFVVPCLQHALFGNEGIASSCEGDFGILLAHAAVDERVEQVVSPGQRGPAARRHVPHQPQRPEHEDERAGPAGPALSTGPVRRAGLGDQGGRRFHEERGEDGHGRPRRSDRHETPGAQEEPWSAPAAGARTCSDVRSRP